VNFAGTNLSVSPILSGERIFVVPAIDQGYSAGFVTDRPG
jgi:hypothetical protein